MSLSNYDFVAMMMFTRAYFKKADVGNGYNNINMMYEAMPASVALCVVSCVIFFSFLFFFFLFSGLGGDTLSGCVKDDLAIIHYSSVSGLSGR